ncbi:hypothetical protein B0T26DRAFT_749295 [Lasiosphaeria miniovina]|uniref:Uncharacterized protein n=1 Tax=Lasiosphaeria miniovina TaxID=1954250 RepID=A0AA40ATN0_9PEZI|nr:uncharacterized protein B0T26DRAFT_749295 [Lasiosphaeria miniovina]KAK0721816.1 hypothetical protein B0T26DRAFT_749295 [Lasiosphaeria miniovina]
MASTASTSQGQQGKAQVPAVETIKGKPLLFRLIAINAAAVEICNLNKRLVVSSGLDGLEAVTKLPDMAIGVSREWQSARAGVLLSFGRDRTVTDVHLPETVLTSLSARLLASSNLPALPFLYGAHHCSLVLAASASSSEVLLVDEMPVPKNSSKNNPAPQPHTELVHYTNNGKSSATVAWLPAGIHRRLVVPQTRDLESHTILFIEDAEFWLLWEVHSPTTATVSAKPAIATAMATQDLAQKVMVLVIRSRRSRSI